MKRFHFRHQKSLQLKQKKKQQVESDIARLNVAIRHQEQMIDSAMTVLNELMTNDAIGIERKSSFNKLQAIGNSQHQIERLRHDLSHNESLRQQALHSLTVVAREVKSLELLRDKQYKVYRAQVETQRQRDADEHAQNQHVRKTQTERRGEFDV
ncbi:MAG: hypothetical protein KDB27_04850 [Planctomycetales bacterium]|nr:hypothetical protein [Planctomycetales bacterium]